jgi:hypothetical protein
MEEVEVSEGSTVFVPAGVSHTYYEAHGPTRYLIILTPRLRQMISELHSTPYAGHADVLKRFESEIVEKAQHQGQSSTERFETLEFVQVGLPRGSTWSLPTGFDYDRVCRESP